MDRDDVGARHQLVFDLSVWKVTLTSGHSLTFRADGWREGDETHVFVALMRGTPNYEYELLRIPASVVATVEGGRWRPGVDLPEPA
jgi:hypothetical protein